VCDKRISRAKARSEKIKGGNNGTAEAVPLQNSSERYFKTAAKANNKC
jgi:hypothetical protein